MSEDLRSDIAEALAKPGPPEGHWHSLLDMEDIADAILDGGIEVRPGVRIMAVEEVTTEKIRTEDLEWLMSTNPEPLRRYRQATDE